MRPDSNQRKARRIRFPVPVTIQVRDANAVEQVYEGRVVDASSCGMKIRVKKFFARLHLLVFKWQFQRIAGRATAGNDRNFVDRIGIRKYRGDERVSCFVIGSDLFFLLIEYV